jgi:aminoglycoside 3-N-acetyltransferase
MMIFGWGHRTFKKYGVIKRYCPHCQRIESELELIRVTIWLTIFFIPVIPTSKRYLIMCRACKGIEELNKETFFQYVNNPSDSNQVYEQQQTKQIWPGDKTATQINYLKEMEAYKKAKEDKEKLLQQTKKVTKEEQLIQKSSFPITKEFIVEELKHLGVEKGMHLLVHSSMSSLGWVCGGPVAVVQALQESVTQEGTIIMPTHSGNYSDPKDWENPPVPREWHDLIKLRMPAFDPEVTPTHGVGTIPELFRTLPQVKRSNHPKGSFAAWGKEQEGLISEHPLDFSFSKTSPLGRLYELANSYVLLLGTDYESNTIFHLAEYDHPLSNIKIEGSPIMENGQRVWKEFKEIKLNCDDFQTIGIEFEKTGKVQKGYVGLVECRLFSVMDAVDFATQWMSENRK